MTSDVSAVRLQRCLSFVLVDRLVRPMDMAMAIQRERPAKRPGAPQLSAFALRQYACDLAVKHGAQNLVAHPKRPTQLITSDDVARIQRDGYITKWLLMTDGRLDDIFHALADPTRRAILQRLSNGQATVTELAEPFAMSQPAISKHLKVLEVAGLISRGRAAQWRLCRLETAPMEEAAGWIERHVRLRRESYDRLEELLYDFQAAGQTTARTLQVAEQARTRVNDRTATGPPGTAEGAGEDR